MNKASSDRSFEHQLAYIQNICGIAKPWRTTKTLGKAMGQIENVPRSQSHTAEFSADHLLNKSPEGEHFWSKPLDLEETTTPI